MSEPSISFDLALVQPPTFGVEIDERFRAAYDALIRDEVARWQQLGPVRLPNIVVLERLTVRDTDVGAMLTDNGTALVTPRLDLRGNIGRLAALHLMRTSAGAADRLVATLSALPSTRLYGGVLGEDGEAAALVAASVTRRPFIVSAAKHNPDFVPALAAAEAFMQSVELSTIEMADPLPPYAFLSNVTGRHPSFVLHPGEIPVHTDGTTLRHVGQLGSGLDEHSATTAVRGLERDVWILPESLAGGVVGAIHLVADIREQDCDMAGLTVSQAGKPSTLFVEASGRRSIFFHELTHAIQFSHTNLFPDQDWQGLVKPDAGYFGSARGFIATGTRLPAYSNSLLARGFITSYASAAFHEDVAELGEALFVGDERLWACLPEAPIVMEKVRLLIEFLHRVDPIFDRSYFEGLASTRHTAEAAWSR
jgi:hypothetical protein